MLPRVAAFLHAVWRNVSGMRVGLLCFDARSLSDRLRVHRSLRTDDGISVGHATGVRHTIAESIEHGPVERGSSDAGAA